MICYKDKTWCEFRSCAKFEGCDRAYTQEVHEQAIKWWGGEDAPVAIFTTPPSECYKEKEE